MGTNAPEIPNDTVFAPSQGPAIFPCNFLVIIWQPVSVTAVPTPRNKKKMWKVQKKQNKMLNENRIYEIKGNENADENQKDADIK